MRPATFLKWARPPIFVVRVCECGVVLEAVERIRVDALVCADTPAWSVSDAEAVACLVSVQQSMQAMTAVMLHLIRQVDARGIPGVQGTPRTVDWLRAQLLISGPVAGRLVRLARAVDEHPGLDQALSAAVVNVEQVTEIVAACDALPADVGVVVAGKAQAVLLGWATELDPGQLRVLGKRVLAYVDPQLAEAADRKAVGRQNATAFDNRNLSILPAGDARVRVSGWLDTEMATVVTAALDPLCSPRRHTDPGATETADDPVVADERTFGQRRADALVEVCRLALNTEELPTNGGDRPQVTLTMNVEHLRDQLGLATLDNGDRLTATQARRLACDAHLLPAVLGTPGQVLDVGQSRRLITGALRRALTLRDGGCAFPGCDRPPRWCDGHHIRSWIDGGATSLNNSVLLCRHHHRVIHHTDWTVRLGNDGLPEFLPPAHVDPHQRPRRNLYHRRT